MCCLRLGQGLLELLRALTGQTESASPRGDQGYRGVWKNPMKKTLGKQKHRLTKKNMRIRSIIPWNYVEIEYFSRNVPHESGFICFFSNYYRFPPKKKTQKNNTNKNTKSLTSRPWKMRRARVAFSWTNIWLPWTQHGGGSGTGKSQEISGDSEGDPPLKNKQSKKNWWSASRKLLEIGNCNWNCHFFWEIHRIPARKNTL